MVILNCNNVFTTEVINQVKQISDSGPNPTPRAAPAAPQPVARAQSTPPLSPRAPPPYHPVQGLKELRVKRKASSTRAPAPTRAKVLTPADASPQNAAASLDRVLPPELGQALKLRFGLLLFGSLFFLLRRDACLEHPELTQRALKRLLEARDVRNPGAYFFRVFSDELAAFQLLPKPSPEDLVRERKREESQALRDRQQILQAQLERVQCRDWEATARVRSELEAVQRERRRRQSAEQGHAVASEAIPARRLQTPAAAQPEPLSPTEQQAEAERVLAMLRARRAAA